MCMHGKMKERGTHKITTNIFLKEYGIIWWVGVEESVQGFVVTKFNFQKSV